MERRAGPKGSEKTAAPPEKSPPPMFGQEAEKPYICRHTPKPWKKRARRRAPGGGVPATARQEKRKRFINITYFY